MISRLIKRGFLAVFLLALVLAAAEGGTDTKLRPMKGSIVAGDFVLRDLSGRLTRFSDFRGKVVLLNFWATWCPPCRKEMPAMEQLYQSYRGGGLEVVAVSVDQAPAAEVRAFVEELGLSFTVMHDRDGLISQLYSVPGVPTSFVVDKQGRIAYRLLGEYDWYGDDARAVVEDLLKNGEKKN